MASRSTSEETVTTTLTTHDGTQVTTVASEPDVLIIDRPPTPPPDPYGLAALWPTEKVGPYRPFTERELEVLDALTAERK